MENLKRLTLDQMQKFLDASREASVVSQKFVEQMMAERGRKSRGQSARGAKPISKP